MDDYKVIKVKLNESVQSCHHIFYKQHKLKKSIESIQDQDYNTRTLFVPHLPLYFSEQGVRNVFSYFGKVENVLICNKPISNPFSSTSKLDSSSAESLNKKKKNYFQDAENKDEKEENEAIESTRGVRIAYILFSQAQSIEKALKKSLVDKERCLENGKEKNVKTGLSKWIEEYNNRYVDNGLLKKEIDQYMKAYDESKELKDKEEIEKLNQPDEDGWITVTPKNRKANSALTQRNIEKLKLKQKKKRQQMQLVNFYSFQMKESKKEYITQLRKKFEEDKKRIEVMKDKRKFKPF